MKGIIAVLQQSESDIVLPVHNRRQDQSAHGFSNKLAPTSLCTLFADVCITANSFYFLKRFSILDNGAKSYYDA